MHRVSEDLHVLAIKAVAAELAAAAWRGRGVGPKGARALHIGHREVTPLLNYGKLQPHHTASAP